MAQLYYRTHGQDVVQRLTVDTLVRDLEVVLEVLGTACLLGGIIEPRVGNSDGAVAASAAQSVCDAEDVAAAADEAVVAHHAPADRHPSEPSRRHYDHRRRVAAGVELLVLTVFLHTTQPCSLVKVAMIRFIHHKW